MIWLIRMPIGVFLHVILSKRLKIDVTSLSNYVFEHLLEETFTNIFCE
jgi:hypothetical protein